MGVFQQNNVLGQPVCWHQNVSAKMGFYITELWGVWDHLVLFCLVLCQCQAAFEEFRVGAELPWELGYQAYSLCFSLMFLKMWAFYFCMYVVLVFFNNSFVQIIWDRESYGSRQPTYPLTPFFHISVEGLVMFDFFSLKMSLEMARIALNVTRSAMWRSLSLFLGLQGCCLCWSFPGCLGWDCHHPQPTSEGQAFSCGGLQWWILKTRHKIFWQNSFSSKSVLHYAYPPSFL